MDNLSGNLTSRLVMYLVAFAAVFVIMFGIRASASVINPILLAVVITITVLPVPSRLTKRGMPGWLALVLSILMVVLLLGLVITTIFFSITQLTTSLPTYMASVTEQAAEDLSSTTIQIDAIGPIAQNFLSNILDLLVQFGLALVIFFFMISAAMSLPTPSRLGLDPDTPAISRITSLTEDVRKYMTILTGVNFLVGLGNTIFLLFLGVDYALLWGMLSWFMGYIPSVGFIIALIPPVLLAYAQYGLQTALIVLVGYIVINGGVQNFYQPKVMGDRLKISPVVVFVGLFIWGYLLGGIGAILAVPMTLLVLIIMENFDGTRPVAILMRYTGEENKAERAEAAATLQGMWKRVKGVIKSEHEAGKPKN
ncbi:MAG TPA: AI-2E family transporter [Anaerolineales bacterium]|nr:AI-2E family transporter [Anaerolineales bacterium]